MIEWFNENEGRAYPLKEAATRKDNLGSTMAFDVLADLAVSIRADLVDTVYVSSVGIGPNLVSISVASTTAGALLVGAFSSSNPYQKVFVLEALQSNVSGYVVFGRGAVVPSRYVFEFAGPSQAGLEQKAVRGFEDSVVDEVSKDGSTTPALSGVIVLEAGIDVEITKIDASTIGIGLKESARAAFVGPCDRLTNFITCGRPPIRTISGVGPDGTGKITIEVT